MNKKIIIGSIFAVLLIMSLSFNSAVSAQKIKIKNKEKLLEQSESYVETDAKLSKNRLIIPRILTACVIYNEGFEIISAKSDEIQTDQSGTMYIGNVEINCRLNGDSYGHIYSYIANKIGMMLYANNIDPTILPGWLDFEEEFTIKARMFYLSNYIQEEGLPPFVIGFGFLARVS